MSRLYFTSPDAETQVSGSEREQMRAVARSVGIGPLVDALNAWDYDKGKPSNKHLNQANRYVWIGPPRRLEGGPPYEHWLRTILSWHNEAVPTLIHDGKPTHHCEVVANTAILLGSDELRLLVRLANQSDIHCFVEGPDRAWMADLLVRACEAGMLRRGFSKRWADSGGWDAVVELLRADDREPVVCHYSGTDSFPNPDATTWQPSEDVNCGEDGCEDGCVHREGWYELTHAQQWEMGLEYIRSSPALLRLDPAYWADFRFGDGLTAFDFAPKEPIGRTTTPTLD
jgi:hypothetical protein